MVKKDKNWFKALLEKFFPDIQQSWGVGNSVTMWHYLDDGSDDDDDFELADGEDIKNLQEQIDALKDGSGGSSGGGGSIPSTGTITSNLIPKNLLTANEVADYSNAIYEEDVSQRETLSAVFGYYTETYTSSYTKFGNGIKIEGENSGELPDKLISLTPFNTDALTVEPTNRKAFSLLYQITKHVYVVKDTEQVTVPIDRTKTVWTELSNKVRPEAFLVFTASAYTYVGNGVKDYNVTNLAAYAPYANQVFSNDLQSVKLSDLKATYTYEELKKLENQKSATSFSNTQYSHDVKFTSSGPYITLNSLNFSETTIPAIDAKDIWKYDGVDYSDWPVVFIPTSTEGTTFTFDNGWKGSNSGWSTSSKTFINFYKGPFLVDAGLGLNRTAYDIIGYGDGSSFYFTKDIQLKTKAFVK